MEMAIQNTIAKNMLGGALERCHLHWMTPFVGTDSNKLVFWHRKLAARKWTYRQKPIGRCAILARLFSNRRF
jgi:hypothetical protein